MNQEPGQQPQQLPVQPATELPPVPQVTPVPVMPQPVAQPAQPVVTPAPVIATPLMSQPSAPVMPQLEATPAPMQASAMSTEPVVAPESVMQPGAAQPQVVEPTPPLTSEPMGRPQTSQGGGLEWQASEYVEHEKSMKWFIVLGAIALGLAALAVFLLKNYTFAILIVVMAVAIAVWAKRPAMIMQYQLDTSGITINGKHFAIHDFRAFGVLQDGGIYAVTLLPNKRFSPGVSIYFPHELGEQIVDMLGASLPMEAMEPDWIDKLSRKLNF